MILSKRHVLLVVAIIGVCASVRGQEKVSCALIADKDVTLQSSALVSLLEARLSQDERIQLLERAQIQTILDEHVSALTGLAERDGAIKVGQWLRVRAFVLLSTENTPGQSREPNNVLIRVRVAETAQGLRLWEGYEPLETSGVEAAARRISERILAVVPKIGRPAGQVIPVGIVDIHRVQLPEQYEPLTRVLPGLLTARLGKEPRLLVLERESLGTLLREKQLTEGDESSFWNSAVLIDGYLHPAEQKGLEVDLQLRRSSGQRITSLRIPVEPNRVSETIEQAALKIAKAVLDAPPLSRWEPGLEAAEFYRQGQLLAAHGRHQAAASRLEAAYALQPDEVSHITALFRNEAACRLLPPYLAPLQPVESPWFSDLELAEWASVLVRQVQRAYHERRLTPRDLRETYCRILGPFGITSYFEHGASMSTEQVRLINRPNRQIWIETMNQALRDEAPGIDVPNIHLVIRTQLAGMRPDEPKERMAAIKRATNEVILPPALGGTITSGPSRCVLCDELLFFSGVTHVPPGSRKKPLPPGVIGPARPPPEEGDDEFATLWDDYVKELTEVDDPLVQIYALLAQAQRLGFTQFDIDTVRASVQRAVPALHTILRAPDTFVTTAQKRVIVKKLTQCMSFGYAQDPERAMDLSDGILAPLVGAQDARGLALWFPNRFPPPVRRSSDAAVRHFGLLQQALQVLETGGDSPEVAGACVSIRDHLNQIRPFVESTRAGPERPRLAPGMPIEMVAAGHLGAKVSGDLLIVVYLWGRGPRERGYTADVAVVDLKTFHLLSARKIEGPGLVVRGLQDIAVLGDTAYVGVYGGGILRLHHLAQRSRGPTGDYDILTERQGLPTTSIAGLAGQGSGLWIAYGDNRTESGLGRYDPQTGQWQTVLCSTHKDHPPLSDGVPYLIHSLTLLLPNRLFFQIDNLRTQGAAPKTEYWDGLWCLDTTTSELSYLQLDAWNGIVPHDTGLLLRTRASLVEFDPASRHAGLLLGYAEWVWRQRERKITAVSLADTPFVPEEVSRGLTAAAGEAGGIRFETAVLHAGTLWARLGESQLVSLPRGATAGQVVIVDNKVLGGRPVMMFVSTSHGLVAIGEGVIGLMGAPGQPVLQLIDVTGSQAGAGK